MESASVHSDLQQQHQRYKILAAGLVISSILPAVTFFIFYSSNSGLAYLSKHLLTVMVAFILEIPLMLGLAYFLAVKRMRFLERSTALVKSGAKTELALAGAYKLNNRDGNGACVLDLAQGEHVERYPVIPSLASQSYVNSLPNLPDDFALSSPGDARIVYGFVDPDTKRPVAIEVEGKVLWISPPAQLF